MYKVVIVVNNSEYNEKLDILDEMLLETYSQKLDLLEKQQSEKYVLQTGKSNTQAIEKAKADFSNQLQLSQDNFIKLLERKDSFFTRSDKDTTSYDDPIFALNNQAKKDIDENKINATLGTLLNEDKQICIFDSVYECFNNVDNKLKASYSSSIAGNSDYDQAVFNNINQKNNIHLANKTIASAGGSGALYLCFNSFLSEGQEILIPETSWTSYELMAEQANLRVVNYKLTDEENNVDLKDLMLRSLQIIKKQHKLVVLINDPCQNPTGICLSDNYWKILIEYYNRLKEYGKVIIINDIAYIDYAYDDPFEHFTHFNDIDEHILINIAYSCSKSLTAYGMRLGANIILHKDEKVVQEVFDYMLKNCRATWSNVNNGFMITYVDLMKEHYQQYQQEKTKAVEMLKERSEAFLQQAKEVDLPIFPYTSGFFITVKIEDDELLDKVQKKLMEKHIYVVKFKKGLRVSICSITKEQCSYLPSKIQETIKECQQ